MRHELLSTSLDYLRAGLCVLPAHRDEKRPTVSWKPYQTRLPTESEVDAWLANGPSALCLLGGWTSGHLETIDFDLRAELYEAWADRVEQAAPGLVARLVISQTQSGGRHVTYRCPSGVSGNLKLAQRRIDVESSEPVVLAGKTYLPRQDAKGQWYVVVTLIETRGEGGIFLCDPTPGYRVTQGDLCDPPVVSEDERDVLLGCAWELNEYLPQVVDGPRVSAENADNGGPSADNSHSGPLSAENPENRPPSADNSHNGPSSAEKSHSTAVSAHNAERPGDDFNSRGDVRAVLTQHGWALARGGENEYWRRPGKTCGWSATLKDRVFYVFTSNAPPLEPNRPYSPFAVYTMLHHGGDFAQAARELRELGYGSDPSDHDVDISHIVAVSADNDEPPPENTDIPDPEPLPDRLLHVPGFVDEVMEYMLATARYGQPVMAFGGSLMLQAFLAGRKIRDASDMRTNLYLLALANSGVGKDHPRRINQRVLVAAGRNDCFGEHFASGEGIEDRMFTTPSMLFQTDEIDALVLAIAKGSDPRWENIMSVLLRFFTSASAIYPMRVKAGQSPGIIDQPSLCLLGTAIPKHYYESMSPRMLSNGFFARMLVLEAGERLRGGGNARLPLPERVVETARWWVDFQPGRSGGNLQTWHPEPAWVDATPEAEEALEALRDHADEAYAAAEQADDLAAMAVWARAYEKARKLALIYAASENPQAPKVTLPAALWANEFVLVLTRQMLARASRHVAESEFQAKCNRLIDVLARWRQTKGGVWMPFWRLNRKLPWSEREHEDVRTALENMKRIEYVEQPTRGTPKRLYRLR